MVLAVASAAQFLAVLDVIAVNIAFPAIGDDFDSASTAQLSWVLNAYTIVLTALLVPAGRLADRSGGRRSFLIGLVVFGVASIGCGAAPGLGALIAARVLQGVGAAVLVPTSLSLALPGFPQRERATALGIWTAVSAVAASTGPLLGGALAASSWRWIFLINVPVVLAATVAGLRLLPRTAPGDRRGLDPLGTLLVLLCTGCLTTAFVTAEEWGRTSAGTLGMLAVGLLAGVAGVWHMRRAKDPVIDPELFRSRGFPAAGLGVFAYFLAYSAMLLSVTLLCTGTWDFSVQRAGLAIAPWPATVLVVSMLSGRIVGAVGERLAGAIGSLSFVAASLWWLMAVEQRAHYAVALVPGLILAGVGTGLYQPVAFAAAGRLPTRLLSLGSGVLMMARQGGTALGVAVLVALTGSAQQPELAALRVGWGFAAAASAAATVAVIRYGSGRPAAR
ncbi:multidrug transporter [Streptomyces albus subsp. albus]|nr:multidrug transporter [Streptomyces albus subsp. albus]